MRISFVIPAHNEEDYLPACLASLTAEIKRNGSAHETEIIVVDNASIDHTAEVAVSFAGVRVVYEAEKGSTPARDRGFWESQGDIVVFIDADTRVPPHWLPLLIAKFGKGKRVVAVSGPYRFYDFPDPWRRVAWPFAVIAGSAVHFFAGCMVWGGNMAIRRSALEAIGGFRTPDTFYGKSAELFYGKDIDTARRLRKEGKVVFSDKLAIEASARRFHVLGVLKTAGIYSSNFMSVAFMKRPINIEFQDFR